MNLKCIELLISQRITIPNSSDDNNIKSQETKRLAK